MISAARLVAFQAAKGLFRSKTLVGSGLVAAFALAIAVVMRVNGLSGTERFETFVAVLIVSVAAPLVSLLLGAWALGADREGGTLVFLFTRPIRRSAVLLGRAAAALAAAVGTMLVLTIACAIALGGGLASLPSMVLAVGLGTAALTSVFVLLGTVFARALYVGLAYVALIEGAVGSFVTLNSGFTLTQHARNLVVRWSEARVLSDAQLAQDAATSIVTLVVASLVMLAAASLWIETREMGTRERVKGE